MAPRFFLPIACWRGTGSGAPTSPPFPEQRRTADGPGGTGLWRTGGRHLPSSLTRGRVRSCRGAVARCATGIVCARLTLDRLGNHAQVLLKPHRSENLLPNGRHLQRRVPSSLRAIARIRRDQYRPHRFRPPQPGTTLGTRAIVLQRDFYRAERQPIFPKWSGSHEDLDRFTGEDTLVTPCRDTRSRGETLSGATRLRLRMDRPCRCRICPR